MLKINISTIIGTCGHVIMIAPYEEKALRQGKTKLMCMVCQTMRDIEPSYIQGFLKSREKIDVKIK